MHAELTFLFPTDPHAGNLLACPDGRLCYLDFGMMSYAAASQRNGFLLAVVHIVNRDWGELARLYRRLGFIPENTDLKPIEDALEKALPDVLNADISELNFKNVVNKLGDIMYTYVVNVDVFLRSSGDEKRRVNILDAPSSLILQVSFLSPSFLHCHYSVSRRVRRTRYPGASYQNAYRVNAEMLCDSSVTRRLLLQVDPQARIISEAYPYVASRVLTDPQVRSGNGPHHPAKMYANFVVFRSL
jgi:hypothetical protein